MIIKSMPRKEPSFGQLITYMSDIDKADQQYTVFQNVFARRMEDIEREFTSNARLLRQRKMATASITKFCLYRNHRTLKTTRRRSSSGTLHMNTQDGGHHRIWSMARCMMIMTTTCTIT